MILEFMLLSFLDFTGEPTPCMPRIPKVNSLYSVLSDHWYIWRSTEWATYACQFDSFHVVGTPLWQQYIYRPFSSLVKLYYVASLPASVYYRPFHASVTFSCFSYILRNFFFLNFFSEVITYFRLVMRSPARGRCVVISCFLSR